jgi:phosphate transport system permease protein
VSAVPAERSRLRASGNVRRRKRVNAIVEAGWLGASAIAVAILGIVVVSVFIKALPGLSWDLFTKNAALFGEPGGGIANAIVGTLIVVAIAAAMALPIGILVAIYVSEFAPPQIGLLVRTSLDILNGIPSIVIGIFVYALLVLRFGQSGVIAAIALAIIMLPLVSRSAQEVLKLVPESLRHASQALGVSKWRTVLRVVLPTTMGGILTGATLAVARAAGETAPILFTSYLFLDSQVTWDPSKPLATIPYKIFTYSESPDPSQHQQAWAAAFVLITFVLVTSLTARYLLHRSARKLRGEAGGERATARIMFVFARTGPSVAGTNADEDE